MSKPGLSDADVIRKRLGHLTLKSAPTTWLDTGFPDVNSVLGHRDKGIKYGTLIEISGQSSHGKTAMALTLATLAQQDGAKVVWEDLENSFDHEWAIKRGLNVKEVTLIQPYVGTFGKEREKKETRLSTAEELCAETEAFLDLHAAKSKKLILIVDSVAAMLTDYESTVGIEGQNMRSNMALPVFMGRLLRRWIGKAQVHSVVMVFLNQLRVDPNVKFGDKYKTPAGEAMHYYAHTRIRIRRAKGSKITNSKGKMVGMRGVMKNFKSKFGFEGAEVGFKFYFDGPVEFCDVKEFTREEEQE